MTDSETQLREEILAAAAEDHGASFLSKPFVRGESPVPVSGRVFGPEEMQLLVDSSLDFWPTTGRYAEGFERDFARFIGVQDARLGPRLEPREGIALFLSSREGSASAVNR